MQGAGAGITEGLRSHLFGPSASKFKTTCGEYCFDMTRAKHLSGAHLSRCNTAAAVAVATVAEATLATMVAAMAIAAAAVA